ncbi:MAG: transglycosylase SLT domain-containing protein, partial [Acidimicrobiia bacterium]
RGMIPCRTWGAILLVLLCLTTLSPAMAETDLERARREAAQAEQASAEAQASVAAGLGVRDDVGARLQVALIGYQAVTGELEAAVFRVVELAEQVAAKEGRVAELRGRMEEGAVAAYMDAAAGGTVFAPWAAPTAAGALIVGRAVSQASRGAGTDLEALAVERERLEDLRAEHDAGRRRLVDVRRQAQSASEDLEVLLAEADAALVEAYRDQAVADAAYRAALTSLEEEERRWAAVRGVEHWRPVVARYFPAGLVDEALAVMHCESSGNPDAVNPTSDASGLFQFLRGTWVFASAEAGFGGASRFDPEANIASAAWLVDYSIRTHHPGGPWGHWSCRPPR